MALEIRPCREEEMEAMNRVPAIVFGNYQGDQPRPAGERPPPFIADWSLCAFEDGELATTYGGYPFVMRLNGAKAPAAGVTFVGTLPWYRRRGYLRAIMEHDFKRRYEQRMEPIAILLASIAAIYQRYGYAVCSTRAGYVIDPRWINFAPSVPQATGSWRRASNDELPLLGRLYREFSGPRNGYLHRAPQMWETRVLGTSPAGMVEPGNPGPSLLAVYEEGGEAKGYLAWAAKQFDTYGDDAGNGQRLFVRDYAWLTPDAYRAMWEFVKSFDLVVRVHSFTNPIDDPAMHILLDPRELHATLGDWLLGRIIDIERAMPLRPYSAEGRAVFQVRDAMCPWNDGRWVLEAGPDGATIARTKETPQLSLDVSALAQLLFGYVSPTNAVRYGRAEAAPGIDLERWDAMFRTAYAPFCPDAF